MRAGPLWALAASAQTTLAARLSHACLSADLDALAPMCLATRARCRAFAVCSCAVGFVVCTLLLCSPHRIPPRALQGQGTTPCPTGTASRRRSSCRLEAPPTAEGTPRDVGQKCRPRRHGARFYDEYDSPRSLFLLSDSVCGLFVCTCCQRLARIPHCQECFPQWPKNIVYACAVCHRGRRRRKKKNWLVQ